MRHLNKLRCSIVHLVGVACDKAMPCAPSGSGEGQGIGGGGEHTRFGENARGHMHGLEREAHAKLFKQVFDRRPSKMRPG